MALTHSDGWHFGYQTRSPVLRKSQSRVLRLAINLLPGWSQGGASALYVDICVDTVLLVDNWPRVTTPGTIHASLVFSRPDLPRGRVWLDGGSTATVDVVRVVGDRFRFFFRSNLAGLTHARPYKKAWDLKEALAEIQRQSGRHFDSHLVDVFLSIARSEGLQNLAKYLENNSDDPHGARARLLAKVE